MGGILPYPNEFVRLLLTQNGDGKDFEIRPTTSVETDR
jgi:hypothetical protein